jgi:hypothetical protein
MVLRLALTAGALLFADLARAGQLCGRSFDSLPRLETDLRVDIRATKRGAMYLEFITHSVIDDEGKTLWVFAKESHPAFPAALCRQGIESQSRCEGTKVACDAFVAKFSTNDWSGPLPK